jgi:hypothetical protein
MATACSPAVRAPEIRMIGPAATTRAAGVRSRAGGRSLSQAGTENGSKRNRDRARASDVNTAHKGRRAEHRARALLEAEGLIVCRAAASKGAADLIAWDTTSIRFISVKSGTKYASAVEREALQLMPRPPNARVEIWRFPDRCRAPLIERL